MHQVPNVLQHAPSVGPQRWCRREPGCKVQAAACCSRPQGHARLLERRERPNGDSDNTAPRGRLGPRLFCTLKPIFLSVLFYCPANGGNKAHHTSTYFHTCRVSCICNPPLAGVSFSSRGSYNASCLYLYLRSPLPLQQRSKLPLYTDA